MLLLLLQPWLRPFLLPSDLSGAFAASGVGTTYGRTPSAQCCPISYGCTSSCNFPSSTDLASAGVVPSDGAAAGLDSKLLSLCAAAVGQPAQALDTRP